MRGTIPAVLSLLRYGTCQRKKREKENSEQAPWKATRHFQDTSNKPTPLHQPAVWMAHGVSSSVELVQGSHAVTRIQLRFWAFREYQWGCCAHQMDRSVCPSCSAYWSFNRFSCFLFVFLFYICNITYLAVSESVSNLAFWIVSNLHQRCFVFLCCYWLTFMAFFLFLFFFKASQNSPLWNTHYFHHGFKNWLYGMLV